MGGCCSKKQSNKCDPGDLGHVFVYIWLPIEGGTFFGHSAMQIPNGRYLSWAAEEHIVCVVGCPSKPVEKVEVDFKNHKKVPHVYKMDKVNVRCVERWWNEQKAEEYSMLFNNCCDVTIHALKNGGAKDISELPINSPIHLANELSDYRHHEEEENLKKRFKKYIED